MTFSFIIELTIYIAYFASDCYLAHTNPFLQLPCVNFVDTVRVICVYELMIYVVFLFRFSFKFFNKIEQLRITIVKWKGLDIKLLLQSSHS